MTTREDTLTVKTALGNAIGAVACVIIHAQAPVVQRIEQSTPKALMSVQFRPGAMRMLLSTCAVTIY